MSVDLTPLVQALLALVATIISGAIPILVRALLARFGRANDKEMADRLDRVLTNAAGLAYKALAEDAKGLASPAIQNKALADAVSYAVQRGTDELVHLNVPQSDLPQMIQARLGTLLASDPTITPGPSPTPDTKAVP